MRSITIHPGYQYPRKDNDLAVFLLVNSVPVNLTPVRLNADAAVGSWRFHLRLWRGRR